MKYVPYAVLLVQVLLGSCSSYPAPKNVLLAFSSEKEGNSDIYTMYGDGSNQVNLTNHPARDFRPAWSPDGKKIAFISERTGEAHIFAMNPDGSDLKQLTDDPGVEFSFSWSPDGTKIGYVSYTDNSSETDTQLMVMDPDGSNKTVLAERLLSDFDFLGWSPDSQYLVYRIWEGYEQAGLYVVHVNDSRKHHWPELSLIERQIYWVDPESFIAIIFDPNRKQAKWVMYKIGTDGSQTEIHAHEMSLVGVFDKTYVVENSNGLNWFTSEGNLLPSAPFEFIKMCELPENEIAGDPDFSISPDGKHALVTLICSNTSSSFFLVNEEGSVIRQVGARHYAEIQFPYAGWSPDGKYVTIRISSHELLSTGHKSLTETGDIYLLDIQKLLKDPSTQLIQLTTDGTRKYDGAVWQPQP